MGTENGLVRVSKFLSYVLRHRPDTIGIKLDREGWADIADLIAGAAKSGKPLDREIIQMVVANNDKRRFAISEDGRRIRAVQGHSLGDVAIGYLAKVPPAFLYHGTATRFLESIRERGLVARGRQYVHLSQDPKTATAVGKRHGIPVVLAIAAGKMHEKGFKFYQAENGVWLTTQVATEFITELST
jgi:putative RNA 2'-phosphotransferase